MVLIFGIIGLYWRAWFGGSFDGTKDINILFANISDTPTTLGGYNITDAYTAAEIGTMAEFTANLN